MRRATYILSAGGLAAGGMSISGVAPASRLRTDAQPVELRSLAKSLGVTLPRLASRFGELAVIGARLCVNQLAGPLPTTSPVYLASGLGDVARSDALYYQVMPPQSEMASPAQFATSGNNMAAFFVAQQLQLTSRNFTLSQADLSYEHALALAMDDLHFGAATHALVGGVDETTLPREYYVRRYPPSEREIIGEGSAWLVLAGERGNAIGEVLATAVLPAICMHDHNAWAQQVAAAVTPHLGGESAATLLPGVRPVAAQVAALRARWPASQVEDYRAHAGCFPTAVALGMAGTLASRQTEDRTYVHVNCDDRGRTGVIIWRVWLAKLNV